jgi:hypothetical protein
MASKNNARVSFFTYDDVNESVAPVQLLKFALSNEVAQNPGSPAVPPLPSVLSSTGKAHVPVALESHIITFLNARSFIYTAKIVLRCPSCVLCLALGHGLLDRSTTRNSLVRPMGPARQAYTLAPHPRLGLRVGAGVGQISTKVRFGDKHQQCVPRLPHTWAVSHCAHPGFVLTCTTGEPLETGR